MLTYEVFTDPALLPGTHYMEIGPGLDQPQHWIPGNLFIDDYDFYVVEIAIDMVVPDFDHYSLNVIDSNSGILICRQIDSLSMEVKAGKVNSVRNDDVDKVVEMLNAVKKFIEKACSNHPGFYVSGV